MSETRYGIDWCICDHARPAEEICANCEKPIWFDDLPGRGWRHVSQGGGGPYECGIRKTATPKRASSHAKAEAPAAPIAHGDRGLVECNFRDQPLGCAGCICVKSPQALAVSPWRTGTPDTFREVLIRVKVAGAYVYFLGWYLESSWRDENEEKLGVEVDAWMDIPTR